MKTVKKTSLVLAVLLLTTLAVSCASIDGLKESTSAAREISADTHETMTGLGKDLLDKDERKSPQEVGRSAKPNAVKMGETIGARKQGTIREQAQAYAEDGRTLRTTANILGAVGEFLTSTLLR